MTLEGAGVLDFNAATAMCQEEPVTMEEARPEEGKISNRSPGKKWSLRFSGLGEPKRKPKQKSCMTSSPSLNILMPRACALS